MNKTIVFDFDGTIADSLSLGIEAYNKIAPRFYCKQIETNDITKLQGKRPQELLKEYGINFIKLPFLLLAVKKGLHKVIEEVKPIEGIAEVIEDIKKRGNTVGIVTSNSVENVETFLSANGLKNTIDFVYSGKRLFRKDRAILKMLKERGLTIKDIIYIGDEIRDIEMARRLNIPIISVSRGLYSKDSLEKANPNNVSNTPEELIQQIKNN